MLVLMNHAVTHEQINRVKEKISALGFTPHEIPGAQRVAIGITGNRSGLDPDLFRSLPGVQDAVPVSKPYKLVSREVKPDDTVVNIGGERIGGPQLSMIAGPCSVESRQQILEIAEILSGMGVKLLRGGAFKPRSSPYSFQGLKDQGLEFLAKRQIKQECVWLQR